MQAYGKAFAHIYNRRWGRFANHVAPRLREFYEASPLGQENRIMLDLCCGTGQLALHFLEHDYRVIGIDLSAPMLAHAAENAAPYLDDNRAHFIQADASDFTIDGRFGLVVSTYDSLNHLPDERALFRTFRCVYDVLEEEGLFIFDLNTRRGLRRWNNINVDEGGELVLITRGVYDGDHDRALTHISGFVRTETSDNLYERFEQTAYNTIFDLDRVRDGLLDTGFRSVHCATIEDLGTPLAEPEEESRVFIVAKK